MGAKAIQFKADTNIVQRQTSSSSIVQRAEDPLNLDNEIVQWLELNGLYQLPMFNALRFSYMQKGRFNRDDKDTVLLLSILSDARYRTFNQKDKAIDFILGLGINSVEGFVHQYERFVQLWYTTSNKIPKTEISKSENESTKSKKKELQSDSKTLQVVEYLMSHPDVTLDDLDLNLFEFTNEELDNEEGRGFADLEVLVELSHIQELASKQALTFSNTKKIERYFFTALSI